MGNSHLTFAKVVIRYANGERLSDIRGCEESCRVCRCVIDRVELYHLTVDHPDPWTVTEVEPGQRKSRELSDLPPDRANDLIATDQEYQRWGLAKMTILTAKSERHKRNWGRASYLAHLAMEISARLDHAVYGPDHCFRLYDEAMRTFQEASRMRRDEEGRDQVIDRVLEGTWGR